MDMADDIAAGAVRPEAPAEAGKKTSVGSPPSDAMIVIPVRRMVMFPEIVAPLMLDRPMSIAAAQQAVREQRQIVILLQRNAEAIQFLHNPEQVR